MLTTACWPAILFNSQACGDQIRAGLLQIFPGKDLGRLDAFCGMQIHHSKAGTRVSLLHHLTKSFSLFNVLPLQPRTGTLANPLSSRPLKADCSPETLPDIKSKHLKLTGVLMWVYTRCRLDLAFPIHAITRVMHTHARSTWTFSFISTDACVLHKAGTCAITTCPTWPRHLYTQLILCSTLFAIPHGLMILVLCVLLVATSFFFNAVKALFLLSLSLAKILPFHLLRPSMHARLKDARSPFGSGYF
jgi:hypothetical protein